jgi:hypothetical protein
MAAVQSFGMIQANGELHRVATDGTVAALGLPAGVTVSSILPVRSVVFNRRLILVNGVSRNVQIDINQVARLLQPRAPNIALTAAIGAAGNLSGSYTWKYTFAIMEGERVIGESELSDISNEVALSSNQGSLSGIAVSVDPNVNARRLYRTSSDGGSAYFLVTTIMDNTTTTYTDDITDEATSSLPAEPSLGVAFGTTEQTRLRLIAAWKDRLWASPDAHPDRIYFSGNRVQYGWNEDYYFVAGAEGQDTHGVTAIVARRNELFVGKKRSLHKITGDGLNTFGLIDIPGGIGVWAPDSVVLIRDAVYFVAEDGLYKWDGTLTNLSKERVHPWFTEDDDTFELSLLADAFAHYNQKLDTYELYLPVEDGTTFERWISFDLSSQEFLGPHRTEAYVPTCAGVLDGTDDRQRAAVGASNGQVLLKNSNDWTDGTASAIAMIATTNPMHVGDVEHEKVWGELETYQRALSDGALVVGSRVGNLEAMTGPIALVSITRVGSVATALTVTPHGYGTGDVIDISGCTGLSVDYNNLWPITRTGSTSFTFDVGALTPETPANGSPVSVLPIREDQEADLTEDRSRLGRLGTGRVCQLSFSNEEANQPVYLRGFLIHEVNKIGRR